MRKFFLLAIFILATYGGMQGQILGDVLGTHNLSRSGTAPVKGASSNSCMYCHAPHSGVVGLGNTPLWSQTLSTQTYTQYSSTTLHNTSVQPALGSASTLCLSCHDGTVAVGQTVPYGQLTMSGTMTSSDVFGTNLQGSHPFSFKLPLNDSPDLVASLTTTHTTADPLKQVTLVSNNVECTSCHNPHIQGIDQVSLNFLVRDGSSGQLCLACHAPDLRTVNGQINPLNQWSSSIHATAGNGVSVTGLGGYGTVARNACLSCHMPHNAVAGGRLLTGPVPPLPNMDTATQNCISCHNGSSNLSPAIPNIFAELSKTSHPLPAPGNAHDAGEATVLNNNRHATCADCHNAHSSLQVTSFPVPPAIRASQNGAAGLSVDGITTVNPAANQYEVCLRCHGPSTGKQVLSVFGYLPARAVYLGDPLNLIPQFNLSATSSHPVMHDSNSPLPQPSLLAAMWNLDGKTQGRLMGTRILCTDCHNSDDNREFGGVGPNGPHGSQYSHVLERRYEFSQVAPGLPPTAGPGTTIQNLFPNPILDPAGGGPYTLCAKCHNLNNVVSNASFGGAAGHSLHINAGFSCSVCHTAHGNGGTSATISGERLVNFDVNVVAPNNGVIAYNRATNTCTLICHNEAHNSNGSVGAAQTMRLPLPKR